MNNKSMVSKITSGVAYSIFGGAWLGLSFVLILLFIDNSWSDAIKVWFEKSFGNTVSLTLFASIALIITSISIAYALIAGEVRSKRK
jgi:hypothetical protein